MSLFVRVNTDFYSHRKTARLQSLLGESALWLPPRLWAYAAQHQPDGDFSKYSAEEIAFLLGYNKDASSMLQALLTAGFLDEDMRIHDWMEHNGYHERYAQRAKIAAEARWGKKKEKDQKKEKEIEKEIEIEKETSIATSMLVASKTESISSQTESFSLTTDVQKSQLDEQAMEIYKAYPRKVGRPDALKKIKGALKKCPFDLLLPKVQEFAESNRRTDPQFIPHPATWFHNERWDDEPIVNHRIPNHDAGF